MTHEQFTQIYLPFSGKMYALAYNLLRNRDEARDKMCTPSYGSNGTR